MKRVFLCHLLLGLALLSAETLPEDTQTAAILPDPASIRFTPPPPPKEVPDIKVESATTADYGTHRITILRGEPSALPDIPEPPPPVEQSREVISVPAEPFQMLTIGGSTYGDGLCHVIVWNPRSGISHEAWCGWDVSLLAPFYEIIHEGKPYGVLMAIGAAGAREDKDSKTDESTPAHPEVKLRGIIVPDGDAFTAAVLTSMREACFANLSKLLEIRAAREQFQKDSDAWKAANPPQPQSHTFWLKPHRGSRYLKEEGAKR